MIHSASHEIYQKNLKALVDGYMGINGKQYLPIDILTFCGTVNNDNHKYSESFIVQTPERNVADTLFKAIRYIVNLDKYDIIIKTNTNTVVNTPLIYEFCNLNTIRHDIIYTNICYSFHNTDNNFLSWFPSGMFLMGHKNVWKRILNQYNSAIEILNNKYMNTGVYHNEEYANNKLVWTGFSDEVLIGACMSLANIDVGTLTQTSTLSYAKQKFFHPIISGENGKNIQLHDDIDNRYACINCKMDIDCDLELGSQDEQYRIQYESYMINLICKLFESYIPTCEDVIHLRDSAICFKQGQ
jgi:hypothetical protein